MNRTSVVGLRVAGAALIFFSGVSRLYPQAPAPATPPPAQQPEAKESEEDDNPFAPEPAPALLLGMKGSDASDPRAKLAPGLYNAGETSMGIEHLLLIKKPDAFQLGSSDPDDPKVQKTIAQLGIGRAGKLPKPTQLVIAQLAFANSDVAFQGNRLFQGNFYGLSIYDISDPAKAAILTSLVCPGGQGDLSVHGNLLFMSVEMPNGRLDCGAQGFPPEPPPPADEDKTKEKKRRLPAAQKDRFRGVRIFDISDVRNPKQVAAVQTCRGSHTHTLVVDPNDKDNVYIYVSGTSFVRQSEELAGCSGEKPDKDPNTALFRIDVIKVPVAAPQDAKIVSSPRVFIDPRTGAMNGLSNGGTHGKKGMEKPEDTDQCHDITVYSAIGLAAGACSGNGILLDVKDPVHPKRVDAVNDPNYSYWHSASFSNDGSKVVFTDEWGGGLGARCRANDPNNWGADAIFRFRGPIDPNMLVLGGDWSAYWYNGNIYASEIARGLDVFELTPTQLLTQNEIDAAKTVKVSELNVQNQQKIEWPAKLVVARAYLDQLTRSLALPADRIADLQKAMQAAESSHMNKGKLAKLKSMADSVEKSAASATNPADAARLHALAEILKHPVA